MSVRFAILAAAFLAVLGGAGAANAGDAQICDRPNNAWDGAAQANGVSLYTLEWSPFGTAEWGWETYTPLIQREIGTPCDPASPAFAEALADPDVKKRLEGLDLFYEGLTGAAADRRLAELSQRYGRIIQATGMKVE